VAGDVHRASDVRAVGVRSGGDAVAGGAAGGVGSDQVSFIGLRTLIDSASAVGARSSALTPLQWLIGILGSTTLGAAYAQAPALLVWLLGIATVISAGILVRAYWYFMKKDPDALRSEKYSLSKMAIERGYVGDSTTGLRRAPVPEIGEPTESRQQLGPGER
jgi:hypothetical protein